MIEPTKPQWACARVAGELAAYTDGGLAAARASAIDAHLAGCEACSAEVADLRRVRTMVGSAAPKESGPMCADLSSRLLSIAGEQTSSPLWMQRDTGGALPSRRAARTKLLRRTAASGVAAAVVVVVLALLLAPDLRPITDPAKLARADFSASMATVGLCESVAAVLLAVDRGAVLGRADSVASRGVAGVTMYPVTPTQATQWLVTIRRPVERLEGVTRVTYADDRGYVVADVRVVDDPSSGVTVSVFGQDGAEFLNGFVSSNEEWGKELITGELEFSASPAGATTVAGVPVRVIEARDGGALLARWWVNVELGLLLWSERYGEGGRVELATGFTSLMLGTAPTTQVANVTQLSGLPKASDLTGDWCLGFKDCPTTLAGLPLIAYATSGGAGQKSMHLVYSDGVTHASVVRTVGLLAPDGVRMESFRLRGTPRIRAWQSGDAVIVVATNGSAAWLTKAVGELPSDPPVTPDLAWKIKAGLERIVGGGDR